MFSRHRAIGWIGNIAVFDFGNGYWLVDWGTGKKLFIKDAE